MENSLALKFQRCCLRNRATLTTLPGSCVSAKKSGNQEQNRYIGQPVHYLSFEAVSSPVFPHFAVFPHPVAPNFVYK